MTESDDFSWKLYCELRKELVAAQALRAQIIGFKITFVTAAAGLIAALSPSDEAAPDPALLVIPALAAIFFDFLIVSYSIGIKRLGHYCRHYLEPNIRERTGWPEGDRLWEEFMALPETRQRFASLGVIGLTGIAVLAACAALLATSRAGVALPGVLILVVLFGFDAYAYVWQPRRFSGGRIG